MNEYQVPADKLNHGPEQGSIEAFVQPEIPTDVLDLTRKAMLLADTAINGGLDRDHRTLVAEPAEALGANGEVLSNEESIALLTIEVAKYRAGAVEASRKLAEDL